MSANKEARVLTVALSGTPRDEQLEAIMKAIRMVKGVRSVTHEEVDHMQWSADQKARHELGKKIMAVLYPKDR